MNQDYRKQVEDVFYKPGTTREEMLTELTALMAQIAQEARRKTFELCIRLCKSYWQIDPEDEGSGKWAMKQMVGCLEKYLE